MPKEASPPVSKIKEIVKAIYECWRLEDYDQAAKTLEYKASDPMIDIIEDSAVAVCPFEVMYEFQGATHHEQGENILVFRSSHDKREVLYC